MGRLRPLRLTSFCEHQPLIGAPSEPTSQRVEILGHSQIGLTLGTYSHVAPVLAEDAARRMGEALWG